MKVRTLFSGDSRHLLPCPSSRTALGLVVLPAPRFGLLQAARGRFASWRARELHYFASMRGKAKDVVLLCNPQAGGRWRVLADVLDSEEARAVHRIVTDEIDDVRGAISELGPRVTLLCIYGETEPSSGFSRRFCVDASASCRI